MLSRSTRPTARHTGVPHGTARFGGSRSLGWVACAVLVATAAAGCGGDDGIEATDGSSPGGGGSDTVVLLTYDAYTPPEALLEELAAEGLEVEVRTNGDAGTSLNAALLTAGDPEGDVLFGLDGTLLSRALGEDLFEPYESPELAAIPDEYDADPEHRVTPIDRGDVCLNYDRAWFEAEGLAPPTTLADLVRPEYRGLLVVEDAAASSPGMAFLLATIAEMGDDGWQAYWEDLVANDVEVAASWDDAYYSSYTVQGGDRPLVVSYASSPPVEVVFSEGTLTEPSSGVLPETCFRQVEFAGVLRGAANPEGARRLIDAMLSERWQAAIPLSNYVFPLREGVTLPDVFVQWAVLPERALDLPPDVIAAERDGWVDEWREIIE